jgi:hypothetical protein
MLCSEVNSALSRMVAQRFWNADVVNEEAKLSEM